MYSGKSLSICKNENENMSDEKSKISKAQQAAVHKYVKNNYDRIELTVKKGRKEEIKAAAAAAGESVNEYIIRAVDARINGKL